MKKVIAVFLIVAMTLSLAACSPSKSPEPTHDHSVVVSDNGNTIEDNNNTETNTQTPEVSDEPTGITDNPVETPEPSDGEVELTPEPTPTESVGPSAAPTPTPTVTSTPTTAPTPSESVKPTEPVHSHNYSKSVTRPTCVNGGYTTYTCECGDSYVSDKTNAVGHRFGDWVTTKEPTTKKTGTAERKCSVCSEVETKTLGKLKENHEHNYKSKITTEATCSKTGVMTYSCSCGDKYTETIARTAHKYVDTVTNPTCTSEGYTTHKCSVCGDTYTDNRKDALGHNYVDTVVAPTCTEMGYTNRACTRCISFEHYNPVSATGHDYQETSNTATCTSSGTKTETCGKCGDTKTTTVDSAGHINTKTETVDSTCSSKGYTKVICVDCGATVSRTTIPYKPCSYTKTMRLSDAALAHCENGGWEFGLYTDFNDWNVEVCERCGYIDLESMRFAYTDYEAALIMLGYVNDLRASVYGSHEYDLELHPTLIELAKVRAQEISVNYSHFGGTYTNAAENIAIDGVNIYDHFIAWSNSSGHYNNMIDPAHKYFSFAMYKSSGDDTTVGYGVQLFWDEWDKDIYLSKQ